MKREQGANGLYACPCCGFASLESVSSNEICEICYWEDDGQDDPEAEEYWGGPNRISLSEARENYLKFGAAEKKDLKHVRKAQESDENVRNYS